jgi:cytochrome bd-type quinol oxidase subunit 1
MLTMGLALLILVLKGYFIITTNAWVRHPVGHKMLPNGNIELDNYWALLLNSWTFKHQGRCVFRLHTRSSRSVVPLIER